THTFRARDPQSPRLLRLAGVELAAGHGVGEAGHRPSAIDLRLGAFGLELVEHPGELGDLTFIEPELVGQEAERPANAEPSAAIAEITASTATFVTFSRGPPEVSAASRSAAVG